MEDERRLLAAVEVSEEDASDEVTWEAVEEVFGILSTISAPSEEIVLGYNAIEENLLVIQNPDAAARSLGLDEQELLAEPYAFVDRSGWYKALSRRPSRLRSTAAGTSRVRSSAASRRMKTSSARNWSPGTLIPQIRGGSAAPATASTPRSV